MKNSFENPGNNYDEHEKNLQKSIGELSKFMLDNLGRPDFISFLKEEEIDGDHLVKAKFERWEERLEDLIDKATKRLGHHVDQAELLRSAYRDILNRKELCELPESKSLDNFCEELDEMLKK